MTEQETGALNLERKPGEAFCVDSPDGRYWFRFEDWNPGGGIFLTWWISGRDKYARTKWHPCRSTRAFCEGRMRIAWYPDYGSQRMRFLVTAPRDWLILREELT